jgi:hypothetical protein
MTESAFKRKVFRRIRNILPGCQIVKTDASSQQGIPDHIILYGPFWATLEFKASASANRRPNQEYYIKQLGAMSFAAFIYPEIEDEVLNALQQAFTSSGRARVS